MINNKFTFPSAGTAFFIIFATFAMGKNLSCSLSGAATFSLESKASSSVFSGDTLQSTSSRVEIYFLGFSD